MGHYCGFGPSVGLSEKSSYASSFPQFIGTNGTSNNWDYGGWHNSAYSGCHQQVYAAGISPGSGYNHFQRSCGNASVGPNDSDSTYWTVHPYQVPDHVQETCSTGFSTSDGFDDCYWSVRTFPVSSTKHHVTQAQPSLHDGAVGYNLKVPPKAEYHEMHVLKVSNPIPIENTLEGVPPEQQSQLCEKKELSLEQQAFLKQKYDEAQDNLNQSEECHERSNEKGIHTLCRKLLADLEHIKEERKTRELEAQRKHEEEEIHKELEHFLYNAFNLFQKEHVSEADIVELDAAYALSYLKEVVYDATLSLCHLNFGKWINQISKEQEQILVRGTLHFLQAVNIDAAKTRMSRTEINIKNQYVLTNKHNNTSPCDLNNGKEVPFIFLCQLPWSSVLCTWDPGIALSSYKYSWLERAGHKTVKALVWSPSPFLYDLQYHLPMNNTSSPWDPGILSWSTISVQHALESSLKKGSIFSTGRMLPSARENVGATTPPNVAAQAAGLAPVLCSKTNSTTGSELLLVSDLEMPMNVPDASLVFKETHVHDIYAEHSTCLNKDIVSVYFTTQVLLVLSATSTESTEKHLVDQELMANTSTKVAALTWHSSLPGTPFIILSSTTYTWDPGVFTHVLQPIFASASKCSYAFALEWTEVKIAAVLVLVVPCSKVQVTKQRLPLEFLLMDEMLQNVSEFRDG